MTYKDLLWYMAHQPDRFTSEEMEEVRNYHSASGKTKSGWDGKFVTKKKK